MVGCNSVKGEICQKVVLFFSKFFRLIRLKDWFLESCALDVSFGGKIKKLISYFMWVLFKYKSRVNTCKSIV